jgi:hypothetical protein
MSDDGGLAGLETIDGGLAATGYNYVSGEMLNFYLVKMTGDGTVGITNINNEESLVKVFPNPLKSSAVVQFPNPNNTSCSFRLSNINGQTVQEVRQLTGSQFVIEKGDLPPGVYFLELRSDKIYRRKIVIK